MSVIDLMGDAPEVRRLRERLAQVEAERDRWAARVRTLETRLADVRRAAG